MGVRVCACVSRWAAVPRWFSRTKSTIVWYSIKLFCSGEPVSAMRRLVPMRCSARDST